jgi:hypothetical protein
MAKASFPTTAAALLAAALLLGGAGYLLLSGPSGQQKSPPAAVASGPPARGVLDQAIQRGRRAFIENYVRPAYASWPTAGTSITRATPASRSTGPRPTLPATYTC